jgi:hypothetical protein
MARTIKRPIIAILCNVGAYKPNDKKQGQLPIPERLAAVQDILKSALSSEPQQLLTIKRLFGDYYA